MPAGPGLAARLRGLRAESRRDGAAAALRQGIGSARAAWLLLAAGLTLAALLVGLAVEWVEREAWAEFMRRVNTAHRSMERRVDRQVELLRGLQGLFDAQSEVSRAEFRRYADRLDLAVNYPGVQVLQFSRLVSDAERAAFVARVRADRLDPAGLPRYEIHPPGRRDQYVAVEFNEPMRGNEEAMGFDSLAAAQHRSVTEDARDSGEVAASTPLTLLQGRQPGIVLRAPLYRGGIVPPTQEQRRADYVGQVSVVVRTVPMLREAVPPEVLGAMRMTVHDIGGDDEPVGTPGVVPRPVYDTAPESARVAASPLAGLHERVLMLRVGDRYWEVRFSQPRRWPLAHPLPLAVAAGGSVSSLLLYWLTRTLQRQRRRALELAARMTQQARAGAAQVRSVIDSAADGIAVIDAAGVIEVANPALGRMLGHRSADLVGRRLDSLITCDALPNGASPDQAAGGALPDRPSESPPQDLSAGPRGRDRGSCCEAAAMRSDGTTFAVELTLSEPRAGRRGRSTCIVRDVTERRQAESAILHLAQHDALTGLPNRMLMQQRFVQESERARSQAQALAVMLIDVDRFKNVNDLLGHDIGDKVLQQIAQRLHRRVRRSDTVARFGGDEFVVLVSGVQDADEAAAVARQLIEEFGQEVEVGGLRLATTLSIGVAMFPADGNDFAELLRRADAAMYAVKGHGRCGFAFASPGLSGEIDRRVRLESEMRDAIGTQQFELHYQPVCLMRTGERIGFEALLRWRHPQRGMVLPGEFVPVAEESGLIVELGAWVLRQACLQAAVWRADGQRLRIAVNLSAMQLRDERIVETVDEALARAGLPADALELEVTESALLRNPDHAARLLERLAARGVRIALDDFGTGYSSLDRLRTLPIHRIKIDRSFVAALDGQPKPAALVRSMVALARGLDIDLTAEGVETEAQRDRLVEYGCTTGQGWLFGRPAPIEPATGPVLAATEPWRSTLPT